MPRRYDMTGKSRAVSFDKCGIKLDSKLILNLNEGLYNHVSRGVHNRKHSDEDVLAGTPIEVYRQS